MDRPLSEYTTVSINLILTSVLLVFIVYLVSISNDFLDKSRQKEFISYEISEYRDLFQYDNKLVKGEDILHTVKKYSGVREIDIELQVGAFEGNDPLTVVKLTPESTESDWSIDTVRRTLRYVMQSDYRVELKRGISGEVIGFTYKRLN